MSKAAFLDVDGTLTTGMSSWERVHNYFGVTEQMEKHTQMFFNDEISYNEWAKLDVKLWKGQPYSELEKALLPPILREGAQEGVQLLKENGYDIFLISGGLDIMVNEVAQQVQANDAYSNRILHTNGEIDGRVDIKIQNKAPIVKQIANQNGYRLSESLALGDSVNDIEMFETVGTSVAYNPKYESVRQAASTEYHGSNFEELVKYSLFGL